MSRSVVADLSALGDDELETRSRMIPLSHAERTNWQRISIPASVARDRGAETIEQRLAALDVSERRAREEGHARSGTTQATRQTAERQAALLRDRTAMRSRRSRVHGMQSSLSDEQLPLPASATISDEDQDEQGIVGAIAQLSLAAMRSSAEENAVREALAMLRAAKTPRRVLLR